MNLCLRVKNLVEIMTLKVLILATCSLVLFLPSSVHGYYSN